MLPSGPSVIQKQHKLISCLSFTAESENRYNCFVDLHKIHWHVGLVHVVSDRRVVFCYGASEANLLQGLRFCFALQPRGFCACRPTRWFMLLPLQMKMSVTILCLTHPICAVVTFQSCQDNFRASRCRRQFESTMLNWQSRSVTSVIAPQMM